ncbi:MAG TPA: Nramp family divalent metal transporter [Bryobacteraceae bacterium]|nr:Nramp family divalent metal transporter [Bryobacteraceae bacterium]
MSELATQPEIRDPYQFHPDEVQEPPRTIPQILRRIGPGMILAASIVGSGELIATTTLGAEVGYAALWLIILSCLIKPAVQSEIGRYVIATGETGAEAFNAVPGPRIFNINWVVLAWFTMAVITFFQIGAMYGGVAQVFNLVFPAISTTVWILAEMAITLLILLGGHYERIETLATIKVCLFTMLTLLCAALLVAQPSFSMADIVEGLKFQMPGKGIATAIAVFGITGVGASELFMYPYWCTEKGYARWAGTNDGSEAWQRRAKGWIRVMNVDILASMVIYCTATIAFYFLGAGVLHAKGIVPSAKDMIVVLSRMYTETLGSAALWLFYIGAIATLYGTIFAATAGNCRVFADITRIGGAFARGDYAARVRTRNRFIWFHVLVPVALILAIESPVQMVKWGGAAQAVLLPIIGIGAVYLRHKRLPEAVRPGFLATFGLWLAAILMSIFMTYYAFLSL